MTKRAQMWSLIGWYLALVLVVGGLDDGGSYKYPPVWCSKAGSCAAPWTNSTDYRCKIIFLFIVINSKSTAINWKRFVFIPYTFFCSVPLCFEWWPSLEIVVVVVQLSSCLSKQVRWQLTIFTRGTLICFYYIVKHIRENPNAFLLSSQVTWSLIYVLPDTHFINVYASFCNW